jgi:hypothetical protein
MQPTLEIDLPLNWHSNCDVGHEANCDKDAKDSGGREKLHSNCEGFGGHYHEVHERCI